MAITLDGTNGIDSPDLNITGTGARITGDFSTVPLANRVAFQTSTVNGQTDVQAIPNGTGTRAGFIAYNNSDVASATANTQLLQLSTETRLVAGGSSPLPMTFYAGGSERLRILTTGGITFNGDTAAANALDDYEEGTFTPAFYPGSGAWAVSSSSGFYRKIGNTVMLQMYLVISDVGSGGSHIYISNIPFPAINPSAPAGNRAAIGVVREDAVTGILSQFWIDGNNTTGMCQTLTGGIITQASGYVYDFTITYFTN